MLISRARDENADILFGIYAEEEDPPGSPHIQLIILNAN